MDRVADDGGRLQYHEENGDEHNHHRDLLALDVSIEIAAALRVQAVAGRGRGGEALSGAEHAAAAAAAAASPVRLALHLAALQPATMTTAEEPREKS